MSSPLVVGFLPGGCGSFLHLDVDEQRRVPAAAPCVTPVMEHAGDTFPPGPVDRKRGADCGRRQVRL